MKDLLHDIGINLGFTVAGLFGSLLLLGKNAVVNFKTTIFSMVSGVASANYLTPIIIDITRTDEKYQLSVAFILGFLGLKGVEYIGNKFFRNGKNTTN